LYHFYFNNQILKDIGEKLAICKKPPHGPFIRNRYAVHFARSLNLLYTTANWESGHKLRSHILNTVGKPFCTSMLYPQINILCYVVNVDFYYI